MTIIDLGKIKPLHRGAYNAVQTYEALDFVSHDGGFYAAKQTTTGNQPPNGTYWDIVADVSQYLKKDLSNASAAFGYRNMVINGDMRINQRGVSGTVTLAAGEYGHDRWKAGASGCTYVFSSLNGLTTVTITAGSLQQVIEDVNVPPGTTTCALTWVGTSQGKVGAGAYSVSGVTATITGGTSLAVEFSTGTLALVQFARGEAPTSFDARPYGVELALCQRYFEKGVSPRGTNYGSVTQRVNVPIYFKVPKRAVPSLTVETGAGDYTSKEGGGVFNSSVAAGAEYAPGAYTANAEL